MIRDNPEDFDFGIIRKCAENVLLDRLEDQIIEHAKSLNGVLNKRGGGGGSKASRKRTLENAPSSEHVAKKINFQ